MHITGKLNIFEVGEEWENAGNARQVVHNSINGLEVKNME